MDLLREAALFLAISEAGSLRAAAKELSLSHAAVSRRLGMLERELGVRLFTRTTRKLTITDAGERFSTHASQLLASARSLFRGVGGRETVRGRLVVHTSVSYGLHVVHPAIQRALKRNPALEVELRCEGSVRDPIFEGADLAIREGVAPTDSEHLIARKVQSLERILVAAPSYLRRHKAPRHPDGLHKHTFLGGLGIGVSSILRLRWEETGYSLTLPRRFRTTSVAAVRDAAVAGHGLAVLPSFMVAAECRGKQLRRLLPKASLRPVQVFALYSVERRGDPAILAVLSALAEQIGSVR